MRYLDCLDFGIQNVAHTTPRVLVWMGNMITVFSDLDRKCRQHFGKKHLKEVWIAGQHPKVCSLFVDYFIRFQCVYRLKFFGVTLLSCF